MMQAVPVRATGYFHERAVGPALRECFSCVWVHRMVDAAPPPVIVTPDATIDLQWIDGTFRVAGPDKDPQTEVLPAGAVVVGFRFQPAAAAAWLGVPAIELVGRRVALEALWGSKARRLAGGIHAQPTIDDLVESLAATVARCAIARKADASMRAAYDAIAQSVQHGAPLVPWLKRMLGTSERTMRRRFDASYGYGPKTLDRILRYQRFLRLTRAAKASTAVLAAEAGYSDQAHLVRESRRLTGTTPARLERVMSTEQRRSA